MSALHGGESGMVSTLETQVVANIHTSEAVVQSCLNCPALLQSKFQPLNERYLTSMKDYRKEYREVRNILQSEFSLILLPSISSPVKQRLAVLAEQLDTFQKGLNSTAAKFTDGLATLSGEDRQPAIDALLKQPSFSCYGLTNLQAKVSCARIDLAVRLEPEEQNGPNKKDYLCTVCDQVIKSPVVLTCSHRVCWDCHPASICSLCKKPQTAKRPEHINCTLENFIHRHFPSFDPLLGDPQPRQNFDELSTPIRQSRDDIIVDTTDKTQKSRSQRNRNYRRKRRSARSRSPQDRASPELSSSTPKGSRGIPRMRSVSQLLLDDDIDVENGIESSRVRSSSMSLSLQPDQVPSSLCSLDDHLTVGPLEEKEGENGVFPATPDDGTLENDDGFDDTFLWSLEETVPETVVQTGLIQSLEQLLHYVQPGSFVAFDIDDTICTNKHNPCMLMSETGLKEFQKELSKNPKYRRQSFLETKNLTKRLQHALREMKLMEGAATKHVLRKLKEKGCWVFALTARYSDMSNVTNKMLSELDIDFAATAPFPRGSQMRDPQTGAMCSDGIIYSCALDKGMVLNRFLENIVFRKHVQDLNKAHPCPLPPSQRADLPRQIIFVDDRVENVESVANGLGVCAGSRLNIPVCSLHYTPSAEVLSPRSSSHSRRRSLANSIKWMDLSKLKDLASNPAASFNVPGHLVGDAEMAVLRAQIEHFVETGEVLNNYDAAQLECCRTSMPECKSLTPQRSRALSEFTTPETCQ